VPPVKRCIKVLNAIDRESKRVNNYIVDYYMRTIRVPSNQTNGCVKTQHPNGFQREECVGGEGCAVLSVRKVAKTILQPIKNVKQCFPQENRCVGHPFHAFVIESNLSQWFKFYIHVCNVALTLPKPSTLTSHWPRASCQTI
jgi:hypothetical protein